MDEIRFDALAKAVARPPSRRQLLRVFGAGGVVAGLAALGRGNPVAPVAAQAASCTLAFVGTVRLGPSAGQLVGGGTTPGELRGQLGFTLDQAGAIAQGQLQLADGSKVPLVGQVTGRAINLRLNLGGAQQVFVAVGTADQDLATCKGAVDGLLTGPQLGDLGDWHGTLSGAGSATGTAGTTGSPTGQAPPAAGQTIGSTGSTTAPTPTAPGSTATAGTSCPLCQAPGAGGACAPVADGTSCGGGPICCGGACIDPFSGRANCGGCGKACSVLASCVNGACKARVIGPPRPTVAGIAQGCDPGLTSCGGACVNTASDASNCGACGHACAAGQICFGGACATDNRGGGGGVSCPAGHINCGGTCFFGKRCP